MERPTALARSTLLRFLSHDVNTAQYNFVYFQIYDGRNFLNGRVSGRPLNRLGVSGLSDEPFAYGRDFFSF